MSTRKKTYSFLTMVILFAASAYFLMPFLTSGGSASSADSSRQEETEEADQETLIPVEIALARKGDISSSISSTANLKPMRQVAVTSQIEGVAEAVLVEEGDFVQEGELLVRLDAGEAEIQLQTAKQKLAQANLQLEKARILQDKSNVQVANTREEYERYAALYDEQLVSEREVAQVKYRLDELEHDLKVASSESRELEHRVDELQAEIAQAKLEIARARIEAPFAGYITERSVDVGQTVKNLDELFQLGDFSPLLAEVFLSEKEAASIVPNQQAAIYSGVDPQISIEGTVSRISPVVDQATGTVKVTLQLSRSGELFKPGAFVRVSIKTDTRPDSILVPKRAIVEEDGDKFVFIAEEDDSVRRVDVLLGYENETDIQILEGIRAGDSVVIAGQGGLKEGSKIRLIEKSKAA